MMYTSKYYALCGTFLDAKQALFMTSDDMLILAAALLVRPGVLNARPCCRLTRRPAAVSVAHGDEGNHRRAWHR